jgi:uncharacterized protein YjbI with pentapeptide repeats
MLGRPVTSPWPIQVVPLAPLAWGTVLWRQGSACGATLVLKATFGLVHDAQARLVAPAEIVREDRHRAHGACLEDASEIAPYLPGAGVILHGTAHAPAGHPAPAVSVRLGVTRERPLVNKLLHVIGYRPREAPGSPRPFDAVPIVYERAFGGPGFDDNPVGTGVAPGSLLPNIVDPESPQRPAGFGPVARHWGPRRRLLGGADPRALELPAPEVPPGFDWSWFHAAPADQRMDALRGDEWIVLDGLHPSLPHLQTRLPSVRAHARWQLDGVAGPGPARALQLSADTLVITPETGVCSLIWRGHVILEPADLAHLSFIAGVELSGYPLAAALAAASEPPDAGPEEPVVDTDWAPTEQLRASVSITETRLDPLDPRDPMNQTNRIVVSELERPALPFAKGDTHGGDASPRSAGRPSMSGLPFRPSDDASSTRAVDPTPVPPSPDDPSFTRTIDLSELLAKALAPFALSEPGAPRANPSTSVPSALPFVAPPPFALSAPPPPPPPAPPPFALALGYPGSAGPAEASDDEAPSVPAPRPPLASEPDDLPTLPPPPLAAMEDPPKVPRLPTEEPAVAAQPPPRPAVPAPTGIAVVVLARLAAREPLLDLDLAGADLRDLDLGGAVLSRMNLKGAKLSRSKLGGARLAGAQLTDADLTGADLTGADLGNADLARAALGEARFDGAILTDANLAGAQGAGASFASAKATRASFARGSWDEASFSKLDGAGADFAAASLAGARFEGAVLSEASFDDARGASAVFDDARLGQAHALGAELQGASLRRVDAVGSSWERAVLDRASFAGAVLKEANLGRASCVEASFAGADLSFANLQRLTGDGADLREARLGGADLRQAKLQGASFQRAFLGEVSGGKADLERSRFDHADLRAASLRGARLAGASFAHAELDGADLRDADLSGVNVFGASRKTAKLGAGAARGLVEVDPGEG